MKAKIINKIMKKCENNNKYSKIDLIKKKYYYECAYTLITKLGFILIVSLFIGTIKELLLFIAFYTPLRTIGFGYHAGSNLECWIFSSILFLAFPYLLSIMVIPKYLLIILSFISILLLIIFAPADTKKRPLIHKEKRQKNKILITIICLIYFTTILFLNNQYVVNFIFGGIIWEMICVSPLLYFIFKQPYNNYKEYLSKNKLAI